MKKKIFDTIQEIRNIINEPYKFNSINKDMNKYFSSLDVLEDTQEAIEYYKNNELIEMVGYKYLVMYGLLECIYVQQQAINDLSIFFDMEEIDFKNEYPEIYKIREIRNDISGHPTNRRNKYSTYLSRISINKEGFEYTKNLIGSIIKVDVLEKINIQEKFIHFYLKDKILESLKQDMKNHYKKFKDIKLVDSFKQLFYLNGKFYTHGEFFRENDSIGFDMLEYMLADFKKRLNERFTNWEKLECSYYINDAEKILEYILNHNDILHETNEDNAFIKYNFLENLFTKMNELYEIAKEIDNKYEEYFLPKMKQKSILPPIIIDNIETGKI